MDVFNGNGDTMGIDNVTLGAIAGPTTEVVPIPGAAWILGSSFLGLGALYSRRVAAL